MTGELFSPLLLRSGQVLSNRIGKAAMEENMAADGQVPGKQILTLYRRWAEGGAGLLITGNVMVHAEALTAPSGVVLDAHSPLEPFAEWAKVGKSGGGAMWMQINHPGRQVPSAMPGVVWAPSAIGIDLGRHTKRFGRPVAMTPQQIDDTVTRFVVTAHRAEKAGFDGVEIHAAHGYLLSQFLSPLVNKRTDHWGGPLRNRARMLLDIVQAVRTAVSPSFSVAVKLNSADFQRGGFDADDARQVIEMLEPLGVDLIELSGGSYESPAMTGRPADESTQAREAYFLDLARVLVKRGPVPLMLTGGITQRYSAERVLDSGVAMVGLGTALTLTPDLPHRRRDAREADRPTEPITWSDKALAAAASMARVRLQMRRLARGRKTNPGTNPAIALISERRRQRKALRVYRAWLSRERGTTGR
ncbi:NADH:flavin oxidoreductase/NADH oxidase family protein [Streptomyces bauhiniae]|uniref:NADH:flavin oxidoreductase/NADH oxidase family protein n=1 Tax=Streptomyces bauhiniae TaxID=2340725 RepID=UPI003631CEA9